MLCFLLILPALCAQSAVPSRHILLPFTAYLESRPVSEIWINSNSIISLDPPCSSWSSSDCKRDNNNSTKISIGPPHIQQTKLDIQIKPDTVFVRYEGYYYLSFDKFKAVSWNLFLSKENNQLLQSLETDADSQSMIVICSQQQGCRSLKKPRVLLAPSQCPWLCSTCYTEDTCKQCSPGYYLTPDLQCSSVCPDGCASCNTSGYCTSCLDSFYLDFYSTCQECSTAYCKTCSSNRCVKCLSGYSISKDSNGTVYCSAQETMLANIVRILIYVLVSLCFLFTVFACCIGYWRNRRRRQQLEEQALEINNQVETEMAHEKQVPVIPKKEICPVCLQENCSVATTCGHLFHLSCIVGWYSRQFKCPVCRTKGIGLYFGCENCRKPLSRLQFCLPDCSSSSHASCINKQSKTRICKECASESQHRLVGISMDSNEI